MITAKSTTKDIIDICPKVKQEDLLAASIGIDRSSGEVKVLKYNKTDFAFMSEEDVDNIVAEIKECINDGFYSPDVAVIIAYRYLAERVRRRFVIHRYENTRAKKNKKC